MSNKDLRQTIDYLVKKVKYISCNSGGSTNGVQSIGTETASYITINNTDPKNPKVNFTGILPEGNFWNTTGNSNLSGNEYIGTNQDYPFIIKQNNEEVIRIEKKMLNNTKRAIFKSTIEQSINTDNTQIENYILSIVNSDFTNGYNYNTRIDLTDNLDKFNNKIAYYTESSKYFTSQGNWSTYWFTRSTNGRILFSDQSFIGNFSKYDSTLYNSYNTLFIVESNLVIPKTPVVDNISSYDKILLKDSTTHITGEASLNKTLNKQQEIVYLGAGSTSIKPDGTGNLSLKIMITNSGFNDLGPIASDIANKVELHCRKGFSSSIKINAFEIADAQENEGNLLACINFKSTEFRTAFIEDVAGTPTMVYQDYYIKIKGGKDNRTFHAYVPLFEKKLRDLYVII